jgi:hypothetical protein
VTKRGVVTAHRQHDIAPEHGDRVAHQMRAGVDGARNSS